MRVTKGQKPAKTTHMAKGNRNFYRENFKALCEPLPFEEDDENEASYSLDKITCKGCLMVLLSHKEQEISKIMNKLGLA